MNAFAYLLKHEGVGLQQPAVRLHSDET